MATTTGRFAYVLPDYTDQGDILQENNNWSKLDTLGAPNVICTRLSRPASPYSGMVVYETDTGYTRIWDSLTSNWLALNTPRYTSTTRPNGAFIGDTIVETDTGIIRQWDGTRWKALGKGVEGYAEITANFPAIGAATDITGLALASFTADGLATWTVEYSVPGYSQASAVLGDTMSLIVFDSVNGGGSVSLTGTIANQFFSTNNKSSGPHRFVRSWVPVAGTHVLKLQGQVSGNPFTIAASANSPAFLRAREN